MLLRALSTVLFVSLVSAVTPASAESYPNKPIRFIVPFSAGGLPDTVARIVGQRLGETIGQPVVVENRAGGGGAIAATTLQSAPSDGYTFIVTDGPMLATASVLFTNPPFNASKDFTPVSVIGTAPLYLAVNPKVKAN